MEWYSITQLSKKLEIPETTTRRYVKNFEEYFRSERIGRGKKFHPESIEILRRIASLYNADYETIEIKRFLADEYAMAMEDSDMNNITMPPPAYDLSGQFTMFQQQQEEFNKELAKQLQEQQNDIKELVETHNKDLNEAKRLESPETKRIERFDQIMTEHKVKSVLEEEALVLWSKKLEEERTKRVGLFGLRKEEDRDKREDFVKKHVDNHFETYLKRAFDID